MYFNKINLVKQTGATYSWSPTTDLDDATVSNPIANPSSTTTYTVTATGSNGCTATDDVLVTAYSAFSAGAINTTGENICNGGDPSTITSFLSGKWRRWQYYLSVEEGWSGIIKFKFSDI